MEENPEVAGTFLAIIDGIMLKSHELGIPIRFTAVEGPYSSNGKVTFKVTSKH